MSVHITTGNKLDVVIQTRPDGKEEFGLMRWDSQEFIPLPNPEGLTSVVTVEWDRFKRKHGK